LEAATDGLADLDDDRGSILEDLFAQHRHSRLGTALALPSRMKLHEPKRILVATDFSPCSRPATEYAVLLARRFGASLHLVYVVEPPTFISPEATTFVGQAIEAESLQGQKYLDAALVELRAAELSAVSGEIVVGLAADATVALANCGKYDLLLLGTHGRAGLKHLFLGSVAEHVIRHCDIPVVTVRSQQPPHDKK
jgi:universal stress protein A